MCALRYAYLARCIQTCAKLKMPGCTFLKRVRNGHFKKGKWSKSAKIKEIGTIWVHF